LPTPRLGQIDEAPVSGVALAAPNSSVGHVLCTLRPLEAPKIGAVATQTPVQHWSRVNCRGVWWSLLSPLDTYSRFSPTGDDFHVVVVVQYRIWPSELASDGIGARFGRARRKQGSATLSVQEEGRITMEIVDDGESMNNA